MSTRQAAAATAEAAMDALIAALDEYQEVSGARPRDIATWLRTRLRALGNACPKMTLRTGTKLSLAELADA